MSKICAPMLFVGLVFSAAPLVGCADFAQAESAASTTATGTTAADGSTAGMGTAPGTTTNGTTAPGSTAGPATTTEPDDDSGDSSGGEDAAVCGDGVPEDGEACDDGNGDDADGCTVDCELTSCRDGVQNGSETALDCGGDCQADCDVGEGCAEGDDCVEGVCGQGNVCAAPTCEDSVRNGEESGVDCGAVCNTAPANVIVNGGFESSTDDWIVENPEINQQTAYFGDGSTNRVVELDRAGNSTSRWQQGFQVPDDQVGLTLVLRLRAGDRENAADDEGGLLVRITGPDTVALPLTGMAGANFEGNGTTQLGVDATAVADFRTVIVHFEPTASGGHVLELLEQTMGGVGLNNGNGMVIDDVEILLVNCEAQ